MLTKRPNLATHDLHKTALGSSNPWNLKQAKLSRPTLYDGHALLNTTHSPVRVNDSEDALVQAEVSRAKMSERPGTIKPINYAELNALYSHFVPQKELSREQVYWLPAEEIASQNSNPPKPVTPFVHTRPAPSKVRAQLLKLKECFPAFETIIKRRTTPTFHEQGEWRFVHTKKAFTEQVIPFYEHVKELVQSLDENLVKEVTEFMRIFDELDTEYEQCVLEKKNLQIEKKNLLIQNECLITDSIAKDICSIVLASDRDRPLSEEPSSNCLCEELRSNCDREHSKVVELEAEILKKQQMLNESEKRCAFIEKNHVNLQVKFQKYKECLQNQRVCDTSNSTASNAILEINKLKDQLQGKNDTIKNLQTHINITRMLNVGSTVGSFDKQALETELSQFKDALTSVRIQLDSYKFVIRSLKSVNTKTLQAKHSVNHTKKVWNATRNHNVNTTKTAWRPIRKVVGSVKPQWKPTGKRFNLCDIYGSRMSTESIVTPSKFTPCVSPRTNVTLSMEPVLKPLELTPCVSSSSSSTVTMVSRFFDYRLGDRKAGSNGISAIFE
ncbi:hypothetical protein Tco_0461018 [Tanacetum coccineum]